MKRLVMSACLVVGLVICSFQSADAFDGEILIAPPPSNWTGGGLQATETGDVRVWRRTFTSDDASSEYVQVLRFTDPVTIDASKLLQTYTLDSLRDCTQKEVGDIDVLPASIGSAASLSVDCLAAEDLAKGMEQQSRIAVYVGEFNAYAVTRVWTGDVNDPASPNESPIIAGTWDRYFGRISVCNTLSEACDIETASRIHANPKFKTMRGVSVPERPILPVRDVVAAARIIGDLTGAAESCGEDVNPLLIRLPRMFAYVLSNDTEALAAMTAFEAARAEQESVSEDLETNECGEIRRQFRGHPSREQSFPRYVELLLAGT